MQNMKTEYGTQNTEYGTQNTEYGSQNPEDRIRNDRGLDFVLLRRNHAVQSPTPMHGRA
jgi:hypothetical protein